MTRHPRQGGASGLDERFEATFLADATTIPPVRHQLQGWLYSAGLGNVVGDAALVCDELMANAAVHGCRGLPSQTELVVTATWCAGRLRVSVSDPSSEMPFEQSDSDSRSSGRGLKLVRAFSEFWGIDNAPDGPGKSVWADMHAPRRAS